MLGKDLGGSFAILDTEERLTFWIRMEVGRELFTRGSDTIYKKEGEGTASAVLREL